MRNRFEKGPAWTLCMRHPWTGWRREQDPCAGCESDPPPKSTPMVVTAIDRETGVITMSSVPSPDSN